MTVRSHFRKPHGGAARVVLVAAVCLLAAGSSFPDASAQTARKVDPARAGKLRSAKVRSKEIPVPRADAGEVFSAIARAWSEEDHTALSRLVAADGVQIAIAPGSPRDSHYSGNQAYYFFKNLFKSAQTEIFEFRRVQEQTAGDAVHAMADWRYRMAGAKATVDERLLFTLSQGEYGWGLAKIRAIR